MSNRNAQQLLMSGGAAPKAIAYEHQGQEYGGRVVSEPEKYHAREYDPKNPGQGALKFYSDSNPVEGINIDVVTTERDATNKNDDGVRRFYVEKTRERQAIADAIRAGGGELLEVDGYLFVAWTGEEDSQGAQPAKTFVARYIAPGQVPLMDPAQLKPRNLRVSAAPAAAPSTGKTKVAREVFVAMINAGMDISGYEIG